MGGSDVGPAGSPFLPAYDV